MGDPEFTKYIIARDHRDILTIAWWCEVCKCDCTHSVQQNHGSTMIDCYHAAGRILCCEGPHLMSPDNYFNQVGDNLGLWQPVTEIVGFESYDCDAAIGYWYDRSTMFIERTASYAFLCMYVGVKTGRDIAGIIARKVAQMYLKDYKWLQTEFLRSGCDIQLLQNRIMKWHPN